MNRAVLDTTKGHADHGKLTAHTNPDQCTAVPTLANTTPVALTTALSGIGDGRWAQCPECAAIDESFRRFIQEN